MTQTLLRIFLLLVLTSSNGRLYAQSMFYFRNIDVSDGLPNNSISCFFEDDQGFMWIGTHDGLVRYDGVSMDTYFHKPGDRTSIGSNSIAWQIEQDVKGRIWILLQDRGFSRYDPRTNTFENFYFENGTLPFEWANHTERLIQRSNGDMLVICLRGIFMVTGQDEISIVAEATEEQGVFLHAHLINERWLWIAKRTGFDRYDLEEKVWASEEDGSLHSSLKSNRILRAVLFSENTCYFSTYNAPGLSEHRHLYSFDLLEQEPDSVPIAPEIDRTNTYSDLLKDMTIDEQGILWMGSENLGLLSYSPQTKSWQRFEGGRNWNGSLLPGKIVALYSDLNNNLWIGTQSGVSLMASDRQYFRNHGYVLNNSSEMIDLTNILRITLGSDQDIWLNKRELGLLHLDREMNFIEAIEGNTVYQEYKNFINPIAELGDQLLIHTWFNGIQYFDPATRAVTQFEPENDSLPELRDCLVASNGTIYAWGWGRFGVLNQTSMELEPVFRTHASKGRRDLVWQATEDGEGNIWLGMERSGLLCLDPETFEILDSWTRDTTIYDHTTISDLIFQDGRIWCALGNQGLMEYDIATKSRTLHTKGDGLCSNDLIGIILDDQDDLWTYSTSGISWYNEEQTNFKTFRASDGMISQNISDAALLPNGNLLLITDRGTVEFDPQRLKETNPTKRPSLRSIRVYDKNIDIQEWAKDSLVIEVPYDKNHIRMEFSGFEFFDPEKIKFAYRLDGTEEFWNYTDHRPVAIYTNLGGGNYRLCVKRTNADGLWGAVSCIPILVTTPFYKKAWFIAIIIVLGVALGVLIYRWQLRKKMALVEVRDQLSRDLHDDVGSALSSINIFSNVAQKELDDNKEKAKELLGRIGSSAGTMMRNMDDIIWTLDPENDRVDQLASRMREFAFPILDAKNIRTDIEVEPSIRELKLEMVHRRNLFLIFKEAINNLAKYSEATTAHIELYRVGNELLLKIIDNGKGFDTAAASNRHGLKNMKERALELKGRTEIRSIKGEGTSVEVTVPVT